MSAHDLTLVASESKGLVYNGTMIRDKGEMLCLTDMWEAAGRPENQRPADWFALPQSQGFIAAVADSSNAEISGIWKSKRGNNGGTFAHWQVGIAYAKALSHDFHMWGNRAIREKMQGVVHHSPGLTAEDRAAIGGIVKACAGVVIREQLANLLPALIEPMIAGRLRESAVMLRSGQTAKQIWDRAGLPPKMKGATNWFGNRLKDGGCLLEGKADRGDGAIRLFDPDKAETLLGLGLLHKSRVYASERMGQGRLKLVEGKQ